MKVYANGINGPIVNFEFPNGYTLSLAHSQHSQVRLSAAYWRTGTAGMRTFQHAGEYLSPAQIGKTFIEVSGLPEDQSKDDPD